MPLTKTDIANIAIRDIGATPISDIDTDTSKEAQVVRTYWDAVVDECLSGHKWSFAKKMLAWAADGDYDMVDARYQYAYVKPTDYIRMSMMNVKDTRYQIRGDHLLTNASPFLTEYIYRHVNAIKWPSYFYLVVAAHLASFIALPLAKKGSKKVDWAEMYLFRLQLGKDKDSQEDDPIEADQGLHTVTNEPWLTVRT